MDRAEKEGLGASVLVHLGMLILIVLFVLPEMTMPKKPLPAEPIEVTMAEDVGLVSSAPDASPEPPAAKLAPVEAPVEPDTAPPQPEPEPRPAKPEPKPPAPTPAPAPRATPKPPAKPAPKPQQSTQRQQRPKPNTGGLPDYAKEFGSSATPSQSQSTRPQASSASAQQVANIGSVINRQIQPCANRQVNPGPGAERIRVPIRLRINPDGSLAARPEVLTAQIDGVDGGNQRYVARVKDLAIAAFTECSPLRGLPAELYDVPRGWKVFTMRYKLPG